MVFDTWSYFYLCADILYFILFYLFYASGVHGLDQFSFALVLLQFSFSKSSLRINTWKIALRPCKCSNHNELNYFDSYYFTGFCLETDVLKIRMGSGGMSLKCSTNIYIPWEPKSKILSHLLSFPLPTTHFLLFPLPLLPFHHPSSGDWTWQLFYCSWAHEAWTFYNVIMM